MEPQRTPVLIVEDSILVALAVEAALAERGFDVVVAGSLAAARERIGQATPAAALLDLHLPDGNALELARSLHDRGCPVAICSGTDRGSVPPGFDFAAMFCKPYGPEAVAAWVESVAGWNVGPTDP